MTVRGQASLSRRSIEVLRAVGEKSSAKRSYAKGSILDGVLCKSVAVVAPGRVIVAPADMWPAA